MFLPFLNQFISDTFEDCEISRQVKPPKINVTSHETNRKMENCTRQIPQLIMRGEHVVSVIINVEEKCQETS